MRTIKNLVEELKEASAVIGLNLVGASQGSEEWQKTRLGVITASNADCVLAGKKTLTRRGYVNELIGQICTGQREELSARPLEWGKANEDAAVSALEVVLGNDGVKLPFIFKDKSLRVGCSPDLVFENSGAEIKCPFSSKVHIDFIRDKHIKPEYIAQVQFSMWVSDRDHWYFCSFDPRMKVKAFDFTLVKRDEEMIKKFTDLVPEMIEEIDAALKSIGCAFGDQWK